MKRQLAAIAIIAFAVSAGAGSGEADAGSPICNRLESRLTALSGDSGADRRMVQRYTRAIQTQQRQIAKVRNQRRRAGCEGSIIRSDAGNACHSLSRSLERMQHNLRKLKREHNALAGGGPDERRERRRLMASLEANHCRAGLANAPGLVQQSPGMYRVMPQQPRQNVPHYRTLCVRACDGYTFPISDDVPPEAFDNDAETCAARCPGSDVELYVQRIASEDGEGSGPVVSRSGALYEELPNASLYRQPGYERPPQCGCSGSGSSSVIGEEASTASEPRTSTARDSDARTSGNVPRDRKVRVVGPEFLPDPKGAIDLRAPAPTGGR
ncbi:DUF2865 domain-containing protein [Mesorhizobium xinjiangense]|uniref:DUF2865 domain-containing protein n=1 Tax=Mesorhizobium xinjiangense TaxID=2678685 RepID=UPI0012ED83F5|nr:DUF2865 domain-containing protein [Mesorhizobium xinjiangense]